MNVFRRVLLFFCLAMLLPASAAADAIPQTFCREDNYTQTAIFKVPTGSYRVYVSADSGTDSAQVYLNQLNDVNLNHCQTIGQAVVLNQQKTLAGQVTITAPAEVSWYVKTQKSVAQNINANRIRVFLVPSNLQICIEVHCQIDQFNSEQVIPVQSNTATNRLFIAYYVNPATDSLQTVSYFADNNYLFSTDRLLPFPNEYQSLGDYSTLSTLSRYASGQIIIHTQKLNDSNGSITLSGIVGLLINPYKDKLPIIGICISSFILFYVILYLYRKWYRAQQWKYHHGLLLPKHRSYDSAKVLKRAKLLNSWLDLKRPIKLFIVFLTSLILLNVFVIDIFDVSGHSMDKTLHTGEKVVALKLPVSYEKFIHGSYIPKRGSIIVARVDESEGSYVSTFGNGKQAMIKRVVAVPGDRVVVKDNTIYVYKQNIGPPTIFGQGQAWAKTVQPTTDHYDIDIVLGINQLFVAGDNRDESIDSRINGPINASQIIAVLVYKF